MASALDLDGFGGDVADDETLAGVPLCRFLRKYGSAVLAVWHIDHPALLQRHPRGLVADARNAVDVQAAVICESFGCTPAVLVLQHQKVWICLIVGAVVSYALPAIPFTARNRLNLFQVRPINLLAHAYLHLGFQTWPPPAAANHGERGLRKEVAP